MIEDDLKGLKLFAETSVPRDRVLAAAGRARRRRRTTRWIQGLTLVSVILMILTSTFGTKAELRRASVVDPDIRPRFPKYLGS